jgi:hypothetical protein
LELDQAIDDQQFTLQLADALVQGLDLPILGVEFGHRSRTLRIQACRPGGGQLTAPGLQLGVVDALAAQQGAEFAMDTGVGGSEDAPLLCCIELASALGAGREDFDGGGRFWRVVPQRLWHGVSPNKTALN